MLQRHHHLGRAVLQRLVGADRLAELLAGLQVFDGHRQHRLHAADRLGRGRGDAGLDHALDDPSPAPASPSNIGAVDAAQRDLRRARAVAHPVGAARDAIGAGIDEKQRNTIGVVALAGGARADDELVGGVAVHHDALAAVEPPAAALAFAVVSTSGKS